MSVLKIFFFAFKVLDQRCKLCLACFVLCIFTFNDSFEILYLSYFVTTSLTTKLYILETLVNKNLMKNISILFSGFLWYRKVSVVYTNEISSTFLPTCAVVLTEQSEQIHLPFFNEDYIRPRQSRGSFYLASF